jgi:hypothetical protein
MLVASVATLTACSDFLEVQDPGRYTDEALNTPIALAAVANGVEAQTLGILDDMATFAGLLSDEYMHTGTWQQWDDMDKGRIAAAQGTDNGVHSALLQARTAAQKAQERFLAVMPDSANRTTLMARMINSEAYANLLSGMHACESPVAPNGAVVSDIEMYKLSIPLFTKALGVAEAAKNTTYVTFITALRARANLLAGNLDAALADAAKVPDSFMFAAKFSETGQQNSIVSLSHVSRNTAGGLDKIHFDKYDRTTGLLKDPWTGTPDPRLKFSVRLNTDGTVKAGVDGVNPHYSEEKYKSLSDDVPVTHGWEMRLIEAEIHMKKGNLTGAMELINKVRANAGLGALPVDAPAADVQKYLLWERFAQLYLEGHRANDLARFGLTAQVMGTGRATKYALDTTELQLNTNTNGVAAGRCPTRT